MWHARSFALSEVELVEVFATYQNLALNSASLFISLLTGYLLIAYFMGEKLESVQLWIINVLFLLSIVPMGFASLQYTQIAMKYGYEIAIMQGANVDLYSGTDSLFTWTSRLSISMMILAAYYFMWTTRKR